MAPERSTKKRKAPLQPSSTSKKPKKSASATTAARRPEPQSVSPLAPATKKVIPPRKRAADFYSDDSESESEESDGGWEALQKSTKNGAKPKKATPVSVKKDKQASKPELEPEPELESDSDDAAIGVGYESDSGDEEAGDQSATLLQGFESSDEEDDESHAPVDGKAVVKAGIPDVKKVQKNIKNLERDKSSPGAIYLGRIPHGFYESEMKSYFSQFGAVTRLRLSRNRQTGKSKHYAFIEFDDGDVAAIVADTMNNYLLFGHILKCKVVSRDNMEYYERLFGGANKKFKTRPRAKLARAEMEKKKTEEQWQKKLMKENKKRNAINNKLKAKGIDYEFEAPPAKKATMEAEPAPVKEDQKLEEGKEVLSLTATEEAPKPSPLLGKNKHRKEKKVKARTKKTKIKAKA